MASKEISLARGFKLPIDFVTQPCAVLGRRGAGKTFMAKRLAEQVYKAGAQMVVIDPVGIWSGLRREGLGAGLPIPILGGQHQDLPLDEGNGQLVAQLLVSRNISAVLDVTGLRKKPRQRFVADLMEELLFQKQRNRSPLHLFFEEAQEFIPEHLVRGSERMVGAIESICQIGRNYGVGYTLISLRPQAVKKAVLNLCDPLIVHQFSGAHERKAIKEWVLYQGVDIQEMVDSLPSLGIGVDSEAYFWSPSWLRRFEKIHALPIQTFDSSATPKAGVSVTSGPPTKVDLEALRQDLESVIEEREENDPKRLKVKVSELERELQKANVDFAELSNSLERRMREEPERVEVPFVPEGLKSHVESLTLGLEGDLKTIRDLMEAAQERLAEHRREISGLLDLPPPTLRSNSVATQPPRPRPVARARPTAVAAATNGSLATGEEKVLTAVVQCGGRAPRRRTALLAGYSPSKSTLRNILSALRGKGMILTSGDEILATDAGRAAVSHVEPLPSGRALQEHWLGKLGGTDHVILEALIRAYPNELDKHELQARTGVDAEKSTMRNSFSKLGTLGLVTGKGNSRKAAEELFQ